MKNHDAAVERKAKQEERRDVSGLMAFMASNGRTDDIVKASNDEGFLGKLLAEFRGGKLTTK